jgi:ribosomal protein L7/L12
MNETLLVVTLALMLLGLAVAAVGRGGAHRAQLRRLARRQDEANAKLDAIVAHLGVVVPEPRHPEVERRLAQGAPIRAVKAYREATGAGLVEAKNAVDEIDRRRGPA